MVTKLYSAIYRALDSDDQIRSLMKLIDADPIKLSNQVKQRKHPQNMTAEDFPLIAFYALPKGGFDEHNGIVYDSFFRFDVYTPDDIGLAHCISERIVKMFHQEVSLFAEVENFAARLVRQFESDSSLTNTYCFSTILLFSTVMED